MALNGPVYMGLFHMRAATVEQMDQFRIGAEQADNDWSPAVIDARINMLETYWQRFQDVQQRLMLEYGHLDVVLNDYNAAEQQGVSMYALAKAKLTELKLARIPAASIIPRIPKASEVRLSKFNGTYTEWAGWRAEFQAKVKMIEDFLHSCQSEIFK